ncbi:MAG: ribosomal-protein-alanine N-acetyltransferase [Alphaproteobacteria bacterium HGW-Alphaproteobacteria-2]|nr:MAG: ribosomal-protein-alanine N-acetyltransferase [Alphaproteobacteria bacterium HGW-Alphaproteobacteria-2]
MNPEALARLHARAFTGAPRPWSAAEFNALLAAPGVQLAAADAGFALIRVVAGEAELLTLAVAPEARRRGLGRALLARAEARAAESGAVEMFLEVAADNAAALALYAAAGYARAGLRRGYYHPASGAAVDALVLRKALVATAGSAPLS